MEKLKVVFELSRDEASVLEKISDDAARAAWRDRDNYRSGIFQRVRQAVRVARARHVVGEKMGHE